MAKFIDNFLDSGWLWLLARILLAIVFLSSGLAKLIDFESGVVEMREAGLPYEWLFNVAVIITLLSGSTFLLFDRAFWLGSVILAMFLVLTIIIVHRFWALPEEQAMVSLYFALEHLSLLGGLIAGAIASRARKRLREELHSQVVRM